MGILSKSPTLSSNQPKGTSAPQNTAVGSGSKPTPSRIKLETSAPMDPRTLGRDVKGSLK